MKYAYAALALAATALAGDYPAAPAYPETTTAAAYPVYTTSSAATYEVKSAPVVNAYPVNTYPASTSTPCTTEGYPVKTAAAYPVKSAPVYPAYPVKNETYGYTTLVYSAYTTACESTTVAYGGQTYTVKEHTTLVIPCTTITQAIYKPTTTPCTTTETYAPYTYVKSAPVVVETPCTTSTLVYSKYPAGAASPSMNAGVSTSAPVPYKQANGASANKVGAMVVGAFAGVVALAL